MKKLLVACATLFAIAAFGCSDDNGTIPPAPTPPPQMSLDSFSEGTSATSHRLPDNEVYDIFVDSSDRLWFATNVGLAMTDKAATQPMQTFDDFNGIPNRQTRAVAEAANTIFVGTWGGGVAWWDETNTTWVPLPVAANRIVGDRVYDIAADDTSIYVATVSGVSQYMHDLTRSEPTRYRQYTSKLSSNFDQTEIIVKTILYHFPAGGPRGEIWCGRDGQGISVLGVASGQVDYSQTNSGIPAGVVADIVYDPVNDIFWSAYDDAGFATTDVGTSAWSYLTTLDGSISNLGRGIGVDLSTGASAGDVWMGTNAGLSKRKSNGTIINYPLGSGLPEDRVRLVYIDPDNRIFVAFVGAGAAQITVAPDS